MDTVHAYQLAVAAGLRADGDDASADALMSLAPEEVAALLLDEDLPGIEPEPPTIETFSWRPYTGPEGGRGWQSDTGEVRYQQDSPDDNDGTGGGTDPTRQDIIPGIDKASRVLGGAMVGGLTGSALGGPLGLAVGTVAGAALGTDTARSVLGGIRALLNRGEEPENARGQIEDVARKATAGDPAATQAVREDATEQVRHAAEQLIQQPPADPAEVRAGWAQASAKMRAGDAAQLGGHIEALATAREPDKVSAAFSSMGGFLGRLTGGALRLAFNAIKAFSRFAATTGRPYLTWAATMAVGAAVVAAPAAALVGGLISTGTALTLFPVAFGAAYGVGEIGRHAQASAGKYGLPPAERFAEWRPYQGPHGGQGWQSDTGEIRYQDAKPDAGGPSPNASAPGEPGRAGVKTPELAAVLGVYDRLPAGAKARNFLDAAIGNAGPTGMEDGANPPAAVDPAKFRRTLAYAWREAGEVGLAPADAAPIEAALHAAGATPMHAAGAVVPFDPERMTSAVGISSGAKVRVRWPGWGNLHQPNTPGADPFTKSVVERMAEHFAETADIALAGPDGKRTAELLGTSQAAATQTLTDTADRAVRRLLMLPRPDQAAHLFEDDELQRIATALAGSIASADLLGRARVRKRAEMAAQRATTFADDPGPPGDPPRPGLTWKRETQRWIRKAEPHEEALSKRLADVPQQLRTRVTSYVTKRYAKMESRYGPAGAKAVMAASILMLPVPIPGSSLIPVALAEAVRATARGVRAAGFAEAGPSDELVRAVTEFVTDLYADAGEPPPALDPERVRAAIERGEVDDDTPGPAATFAEHRDDPFHSFDEPIPAVQPTEAVDYFRRLVPSLGTDPGRYGPMLQRHAFTLAVATEQTLLDKVRKAIAESLVSGVDATPDVQDILDAAGVSPRNPQYAEMVVRTNQMDALNTGAMAEMQHPEMQEAFPIWRYDGILDSRTGDDHRPLIGRHYPNSAAFADVRGPRVFNCRCSPTPVWKGEAAELMRAGKVERG